MLVLREIATNELAKNIPTYDRPMLSNTMSSVKKLVLLPYHNWEGLKKVNTMANTMGVKEVDIMTKHRPEESVEKRKYYPKHHPLP